MTLDETDSRLLAALQKDAHLTAQELGERLHLSPSQAGRRRQRLETEGYIEGYRAKLNPIR
ncbi:MAG: DNA-binding Lrp family transcriptional regulator, partial [Sulfitobacter sp.]